MSVEERAREWVAIGEKIEPAHPLSEYEAQGIAIVKDLLAEVTRLNDSWRKLIAVSEEISARHDKVAEENERLKKRLGII